MTKLKNFLFGKRVLIIGGTGTLGNELVKTFYELCSLIVLSRDEWKQWLMREKFPKVKYILGNISDRDRMNDVISRESPEIVIVVSALKHIDFCEMNVSECISTNILGPQNIVEICGDRKSSPSTILFVSTDKACSPCTAYGMSKSITERLFAEASLKYPEKRFLCVRYGNVLNSRGSIIPKLEDMAKDESKTYFPLTHKDMTRFFMTVQDSVDLIVNTLLEGKSGETWIPKIDSFKIEDLMDLFSKRYNKPIKIIGLRSGEKIHETLINGTEWVRTYEQNVNDKCFYVIKSCYENTYSSEFYEYTSEKASDKDKIPRLLSTIFVDF